MTASEEVGSQRWSSQDCDKTKQLTNKQRSGRCCDRSRKPGFIAQESKIMFDEDYPCRNY